MGQKDGQSMGQWAWKYLPLFALAGEKIMNSLPLNSLCSVVHELFRAVIHPVLVCSRLG